MDMLTAFTDVSLAGFLVGLGMAVLGLVSHFLKKVMKDKEAGFLSYWTDNKKESIMSVIGMIVGVVALLQANEVSPIAYFGAGYVADSVLNKARNRINRAL